MNQLQAALDQATGTEHGSGQHRILESLLNSIGLIPNNPLEAVEMAENLISEEYAKDRKLDDLKKGGEQKKLL